MNIWDDSDDENNNQTTVVTSNAGQARMQQNNSDSEDDKPKILKRKDEKLLDTIKEYSKKLKNSLESKTYQDILDSYEKLIKLFPQVEKVFVGKEVPKIYSKSLYLIQKSVNLSNDEVKKLANKNQYSKLKKMLEDMKDDVRNVIEDYVVDKESDDELNIEEDQQQLSDISDEEPARPEPAVDPNKYKDSDDPAVRRLKWVKKAVVAERPRTPPTGNNAGPNQNLNQNVAKAEKIDKILKNLAKQDDTQLLTDKEIEKEYNEKLTLIGQVNKPADIIERTEYLASSAKDKYLKLKLTILLLTLYFDTTHGMINEVNITLWRRAYTLLNELNLQSIEIYEELLEKLNNGQEDALTSNLTLNLFLSTILSFLERLEIELYKALQYSDLSTSEMIERIKDESKFVQLCFNYRKNPAISSKNLQILSHINLLIILHIYYKKSERAFNNELQQNPEIFDSLLDEIYVNLDNKSKIKALLCSVYFKSVNNQYEQAHLSFSKTNLSEIVSSFKDDILKAYYNRAVAQIGLSAFRSGDFKVSHTFLSTLCSSGTSRLRDNLLQTNEQLSNLDKEEKRKLIPYIMTINIDEIETVFFLTSLVIELDQIVLQRLGIKSFDSFFKRQIDSFERLVSLIFY